MGVVNVVKRQAKILGFVAAVIVALFAVTAAVPFSLLPIYLGGWMLILASTALKGTRLADGWTEAVPFVFDGVALFLFMAVTFIGFDSGILSSTVAGLVGFAAVVYSMSL